MFTKALMSAAAMMSALALSSAVHAGPVYQGGPKATLSTPARAQTFQTNKPYAQYAPEMQAGVKNPVYLGGPKSSLPHVLRR